MHFALGASSMSEGKDDVGYGEQVSGVKLSEDRKNGERTVS